MWVFYADFVTNFKAGEKSLIILAKHVQIERQISSAHLIFRRERVGRWRKNTSKILHHMECDRIECYSLFFVYFTYFACLLAFTCRKKFVTATQNMAYALLLAIRFTLALSVDVALLEKEFTFPLFVAFRTESFINYISNVVAYGSIFSNALHIPENIYIAMMKNNWRKHTHTLFACVWCFKFFPLLALHVESLDPVEFLDSSIFRCIKSSLQDICIEHVALLDFFSFALFTYWSCYLHREARHISARHINKLLNISK